MVEGLEAQYEQTLKNIHTLVTSQEGFSSYIGNIRTLFKAYPRKDIDRAIELLERSGGQAN